ncbi:reverse transcriptase domain-containing protein [Tanacetum coccineum]
MVVEEEGLTWMTPIRNYLEKGMLPEDPVNARTLMEKIGNYTMEDGVLYRNSYLAVAKAMNLGYYWPSMHRDARELIRACDDCQAHASVPRLPKAEMISVTSAWPFMKLGMDIVGPLPKGPGRVKYLIVANDYFTKWMEAKPLATITGRQVKWVEKLKIQLISTLFYHPYGNGAVERANRSLLRGIKTRLEKLELYWSILHEHTQRLEAMPSTLFAEIDRDVRELYTRSGAVWDEIFSQRYRLRSLEQEQERAVMTFGALWRLVLALEAWAEHVDTRMASMSRAGYDDHRLVHDLLVQQAAL